MKNKLKNKIATYAMLLGASLMAASCSSWTDVEGIEIKDPNIADQNPALYAKYLENLKAYKNSDHKATYVWFDNSEKTPFNRSQHLSELPDSLDVVALMYPTNLVEREVADMAKIRQEKGTKFIFTIDYDLIKMNYDIMVAEKIKEDATFVPTEFGLVLVDTVKQLFHAADQYNFDGISIGYKGRSTIHMTEQEIIEYTRYEKTFIGMITDWHTRRPDRIIVFEGKPQNLLNKSILNDCKLIILPATDATNEYLLTYNVAMAKVEGVPTDRFAVSVMTTSLDKTDTKTGYFSNGTRALTSAAQWSVSAHADFDVNGLGIYQVNTDYFNTDLVYKHSRNAISTLSPSIKN